MKAIKYTTYEQAKAKQDYIYDLCRINGIFSQNVTAYCEVLSNSNNTEFYIPIMIERTQGYGFSEEDFTHTIDMETLSEDIWHDETKPIQIKMSYNDNINMLVAYPEFGMYRKQNNIETYTYKNYTYFYVNYILDEHRVLLNMYNAIITEK